MADSTLQLTQCPFEVAARRDFMEGFDFTVTSFLASYFTFFFSLLLSLGSDHILNTGYSHLSSSLQQISLQRVWQGGWQMQAEAQAGQEDSEAPRAALLPHRSLAPRFVRDSKATFLHPPPHHLLTKPCLRKGFCRPASDCCKGRCNLHFLVAPG